MHKLFSLLLSLLIALPMLFLAGCQGNPSGDDDDDNGGGLEFKTWEYVQGFRAALKSNTAGAEAIENPSEYGFFLFDRLSDALLNSLLASYGTGGTTTDFIGNDINNPYDYVYPNISLFGTDSQRSFLNYDVIRHTSSVVPVSNYYRLNLHINTAWDWAFHYGQFSVPHSITSGMSYVGGNEYYKERGSLSELVNDVTLHYPNHIDNYYTWYKKIYNKPLIINIFEVLLDIVPTKFKPVYYANSNYGSEVLAQEGSETWLTMQVAGEYELGPFNPEEYNSLGSVSAISTRLEWLKQEYARSASYIGIQWQEDPNFNGTGTAQSDGGRIVQFMLNNVIGATKVSNDNYNIVNELSNPYIAKNYYQDTITNIVKELVKSERISQDYDGRYDSPSLSFNPGDTAGAFFPVAGIQYTDYRLNDFMVPEVGDNDFAYSPSKEYQSLLILPKKDMVFQSSILLFQSLTHDLTINVRMRWYNHGTKQTTVQNVGLMQLTAGAYHWETNDNSILVEPPYDAVANLNTSNMPQALAINNDYRPLDRRTNSSYYKTINSANGFGTVAVTNEDSVNFSFFEFVFDVVKSPYDPPNKRYDFQVVMMMFAVAEIAS